MKKRDVLLLTGIAGWLLCSGSWAKSETTAEAELAPAPEPVVVQTDVAPAEVVAPEAPPVVVVEPTVETPEAPASIEEPSAPTMEAPAPVVTPLDESAETPASLEPLKVDVEKGMAPGIGVEPSSAKPELLSISLDNVPLNEVVRMFTRVSGANIVAGTNLQGTVTVSLKDVEWEPALRVILDSANMTLVEKRPGIYSIISKSELAGEPLTSDTIFLKYTTTTNVIPVIQKMLVSSNSSVSAFASANAVVVQETASRIATIREVVNRIDKPRSQVFIEAKFVELNDKAIKDLGINWKSLQGYTVQAGNLSWGREEARRWDNSKSDSINQYDNRRQNDTLSESYDMAGIPIGGGRSFSDSIERGRDVQQDVANSFNKTVTDLRTAVLSADEFAITLSALKQQNGASVVSNPKLIVASGEKATIHVGEDYPNIKAKPQGSETITYVYELDYENPIKIGVTVDVIPTVNTESNISVRIQPRLTRQTGDYVEPTPGLKFPVQSSTEVVTDFTLESDRTVAIGGLTRLDDRDAVSKIPLLGDIPLIGKLLFRHTHKEKTQTETIIFVTVSLAKAETISETGGIPEDGQLIYRHLSQQRQNATPAAKSTASAKPRVNPPAPAKNIPLDPNDPNAPVGR
jgi:type II secretory pathway component GspD/PulD (secretin)